ncbi:MAG: thiamine-phosphate kinase [Nitrospirota bacterium]
MKLSKLGEFGLIKKIRKKIPSLSPEVLTGIGDDAAVLKVSGKKILITSDMLVEGVHFDLSYTSFFQLGHKFLAVNISDILAMNGKPKHFLVSLGVPDYCGADEILELYSGINHAAAKFGITVAGGDTCASKHGLVLSGTLTGDAGGRPVTRAGAEVGDGIYVTGTLGDSAMGLFLLQSEKPELRSRKSGRKRPDSKLKNSRSAFPALHYKDVRTLIKKHLMPEPVALKNPRQVKSMIDVSDGLLADLGHICDESRAGAVIYKDSIPLSREILSAAKSLGRDPFDFALKGGEDYVLLYTAPPTYRTGAYRIGEIIRKGRYIIDGSGRKVRFKAEGYEHFKKQRSAFSYQLSAKS